MWISVSLYRNPQSHLLQIVYDMSSLLSVMTCSMSLSFKTLILNMWFFFPQGSEGVLVPYSTEDSLYDQLAGVASAGHHPAHRVLVPGGLDICRLSAPRQEAGTYRGGLHPGQAAVQHVPLGSLGLHDGCR